MSWFKIMTLLCFQLSYIIILRGGARGVYIYICKTQTKCHTAQHPRLNTLFNLVSIKWVSDIWQDPNTYIASYLKQNKSYIQMTWEWTFPQCSCSPRQPLLKRTPWLPWSTAVRDPRLGTSILKPAVKDICHLTSVCIPPESLSRWGVTSF